VQAIKQIQRRGTAERCVKQSSKPCEFDVPAILHGGLPATAGLPQGILRASLITLHKRGEMSANDGNSVKSMEEGAGARKGSRGSRRGGGSEGGVGRIRRERRKRLRRRRRTRN